MREPQKIASLKRPIDYDASQGARFEVHFTKSRGFFGEDAAPFEARLIDGRWDMAPYAFSAFRVGA